MLLFFSANCLVVRLVAKLVNNIWNIMNISKKLGLLFFLITGFLGGTLWSMERRSEDYKRGVARAQAYSLGSESVKRRILQEDHIRELRYGLDQLRLGWIADASFQGRCYGQNDWQGFERAIDEQQKRYWREEASRRRVKEVPPRPRPVPVMTDHEREIHRLQEKMRDVKAYILSNRWMVEVGVVDPHIHFGILSNQLDELLRQGSRQ